MGKIDWIDELVEFDRIDKIGKIYEINEMELKQAGAELCQALNSNCLCMCVCVSVLSLLKKNAAMGFRA